MDVKQLINGAALALGVWAASTGVALAEDPPGEPREGGTIVVNGAPQGPSGQYIRTRQTPRFETVELRRSFVRQIPRAVRRSPF